jgi:hypothetical protein
MRAAMMKAVAVAAAIATKLKWASHSKGQFHQVLVCIGEMVAADRPVAVECLHGKRILTPVPPNTTPVLPFAASLLKTDILLLFLCVLPAASNL